MSNQASSSTPTTSEKGNGLSIASLVLGILSLCGSGVIWCGGILSLVGIILGALGINSKGRGMAIAGIILSAVGLLLAIVIRIFLRGVVDQYMPNILQQVLNSRGY
jgi:hypothetical protein